MSVGNVIRRVVGRLPPGFIRWVGRVQMRVPLLKRALGHVSGAMVGGVATIAHGIGAGMRIQAPPANPGYALGTTEPVVQDVLARLVTPGSVFYDVGANVGFFTLLAARLVGPQGHVHAFEPLPGNIERLRENVRLNNLAHVVIEPVAVSATSGSARLLVGTSTSDSRLPRETDDESDEGESLEVRTVSLDDVVADGRPAPDFVKIDTEGAESDVFRGMHAILAQDRPVILCEVHEFATAQGMLDVVAGCIEAAGGRATVERDGAPALGASDGWGYRLSMLEAPPDDTEVFWAGHVLAVPESRP